MKNIRLINTKITMINKMVFTAMAIDLETCFFFSGWHMVQV